MTSPAYVAKRLARLAAEIRVEMDRPTVLNHPRGASLRTGLELCADDLAALSEAVGSWDAETPATVSEGVSAPVRFGFIATGRDGFAGPEIYAQDEAGTVWAGGDEGISNAHRFASREAAAPIASTRGGYPYPVPAA